MSDLPQYAPLKIEIPAEVVAEMRGLSPALISESLAPSEAAFFAPPFEIASQADMDKVSRGDFDINGRFIFDWREIPCACGFSLTEVVGTKLTREGRFVFRGTQRGQWVWRNQFISHATAIRAFVESLPFSSIDIVRAIKLAPHGIHVPHFDSLNESLVEAGHVTLTFVIAPGEKTKAKIGNDLIDLDAPAYFFQDNNPWGMVAGNEEALMLKVCGYMDADKLKALFASAT